MSTFRSEQLRQPLSLSGSFTGSLQGTASFATTASYAIFAANGGGSSSPTSFISTGSVSASVNVNDGIFKIISGSNTFVYVNTSGSIGLGNVPTYSLDVNLGDNKAIRLQSSIYNSAFLGIPFGNSTLSNNVYFNGANWIYEKTGYASIIQLGDSGTGNGDMSISTYPSRTAGSILPAFGGVIKLTGTGLVGIGTTSPGYNLDVSGSLNISNLIYLNGSTGNTGEVLTSQGSNPPIWAPATASLGYTQLLQIFSQTSNNAPTVDYQKNTTEATYTWTYSGGGEYTLTADDPFTPFAASKTSVILSPGYTIGSLGSAYIIHYEIINTSTIKIFSENASGVGKDDVFSQATLDIKIFP